MTSAGDGELVDHGHLALAVAVAGTVGRRASPNPAIGCVLADGSEVLAIGATQPAGGAHAEVVALSKAAAHRVAGCTAYVTLAPCNHHGRTPPCVDALIAAGVTRVVVAIDDPHPAAGGGLQRLRDAGVAVALAATDSSMARAVTAQLEGFLSATVAGRAHVTLKTASCRDGRMTLPSRRWITGPAARRAVHVWRASVDAVLVGVGTVIADDPQLTVRPQPPQAPQPRALVFDSRLRLPLDAQVVHEGTIVVTATDHDVDKAVALRQRGVEVLEIPAADDGRVDLFTALTQLPRHGVLSVLAEPGPTLGTALLDAQLVDRLVEHVAACPHDANRAALQRQPNRHWELERLGGAGADLIVQWIARHTLSGVHTVETA